MAGLLFAGAEDSRGAQIDWNVPSGSWDIAGNWTGNTVPTSADSVFITNGGTTSVGVGVSATSGGMVVGYDNLDGTLLINGGHLNSLGTTHMGYVGKTGTPRVSAL